MYGKNQQLVASLSQVTGSSFASLVTVSEVKLKGGKKNPMQGRITKKSEGGCVQLFGTSNGYRNMKQRAADKAAPQGTTSEVVEIAKRPWGERVNNTPLVTNKGNLYVEVIYRTLPKTSYMLDGQPIAKHDIEGLNPSRSSQGIALRVLKLETVKSLKMGKLSVL